MKNKKYCKIKDHPPYAREYKEAGHSICNLKCNVPSQIYITFQNGSNYGYHFIIKELAEEF